MTFQKSKLVSLDSFSVLECSKRLFALQTGLSTLETSNPIANKQATLLWTVRCFLKITRLI